MKKQMYFLFLMIFAVSISAKNPKRVVVFGLDGISVEGFVKAYTPNLDALLSEGVLSLNTRVVMPSVTLPNWTSHLTGSGPEQHGVFNNGWTLAKNQYPIVAKDEDGYYPSIFTILKQHNPQIKTAFYYNWINLLYPYNKKYIDEINFLEKDEYQENYDKAFDFILSHKDESTFVFLYSVHTDHAGHAHKWMSDKYIRSIEVADVEIGVFIERMKEMGLFDDTYFVFISDHGGKGHGHGGTSAEEMIVPWGIKGPIIKKGIELKEANNTINTAPVILKIFKIDQPEVWIGKVPHVFK